MDGDRLADRARRSDPRDGEAAAAWARARARREGPEVFLEPLADLLLWDRASAPLQDLAIHEAGRRLAPSFEPLDTRAWPCDCRVITDRGPRALPMRRRLARLRHRASGIEFVLLPGQGAPLPAAGLLRINTSLGVPKVINAGAEPLELRGPPGEDGPAMILAPRLPRDLPRGLPTRPGELRVRRPVPRLAPFLMARRPLSRAEAAALFGDGPPERPALPEVGRLLAPLVRAARARGLGLPSSCQWRYAARAGTYTRFFFGDRFDRRYIWFAGNSEGRARDPGAHEALALWNAFGLVDTLGNVWEWCQDEGGRRPLQLGGSFRTSRRDFDSAKRSVHRGAVAPDIGFRLCAPFPEESGQRRDADQRPDDPLQEGRMEEHRRR